MNSDIGKFLILFNRLKSETNNSLKNLKWLPASKPEIVTLCYELDQTHSRLKSVFAAQSTKYSVVPKAFQKYWDEYNFHYEKKVEEIAKPQKDQFEKELMKVLGAAAEEAETNGQSKEDFWSSITEGLPCDIGYSFNPVKDDAASLVDELITCIHDIVANDLMPEVFTDQQIGALNHFENVIGINYHHISRRWQNTPSIFISDNLRKNIEKLVDLYNEAARCYVFGLNVAAIALCRALLEHILVRYYGIPTGDLDKVISLAEKKFKKLESLKLHELRKDGNAVLHKFETMSEIEEGAAVGYLMTIRTLVNLIPD